MHLTVHVSIAGVMGTTFRRIGILGLLRRSRQAFLSRPRSILQILMKAGFTNKALMNGSTQQGDNCPGSALVWSPTEGTRS